jgi:hypothetical protein
MMIMMRNPEENKAAPAIIREEVVTKKIDLALKIKLKFYRL